MGLHRMKLVAVGGWVIDLPQDRATGCAGAPETPPPRCEPVERGEEKSGLRGAADVAVAGAYL